MTGITLRTEAKIEDVIANKDSGKTKKVTEQSWRIFIAVVFDNSIGTGIKHLSHSDAWDNTSIPCIIVG